MKHNKNLNIELSWHRFSDELRYYYWRVEPSQLSWWNSIFHNNWNMLKHALYDSEQYWNELHNLKTIEDVERYKELEWNKIQVERDKNIKLKIKFPYDDFQRTD